MAWTYDVTTDRGKVRLLATDTDTNNQIFTDAEIDAFLSMTQVNSENIVFYAAAMALETLASQEALILKVIKSMDLQTDGAKLSAELRARAADLRKRIDDEVAFDWAEMALDPFTERELIWKDALRRQ